MAVAQQVESKNFISIVFLNLTRDKDVSDFQSTVTVSAVGVVGLLVGMTISQWMYLWDGANLS